VPITRDRAVAVGILGLVLFAWLESYNFPEEARVFPRLILLGMGALGLVYLAKSLASAPEDEGPFIQNPRNFLLVLVSLALYFLVMPWLGYFTTSTLFMLGFSYLVGYRKVPQLLAVTAVFIVLLWVTFVWVFQRPLPLEFWQV